MTAPDISPETARKLQQFRQQIDAIDEQLIALFKERIGIVRQVGAMKRAETELQCFIRSGREADMLRRIYGEFSGTDFQPLAATAIWRQIIAASTHLEQPLTLSLDCHHHPELYWLAREYFGRFAAITEHLNAAEVLDDVIAGRTNIAVLPYPADSPGGWWLHMAEKRDCGLRVFACLPFAETDRPKALALAKLLPEATDDDVTLLIFELEDAAAIAKISACLQENETRHRLLASKDALTLLELDGYFPEGDPSLARLRVDLDGKIRHIHWLGSYARPIRPS